MELGRSQVTAHHVQGVVPGGGGGPAHGGEVGGQEVPGPRVLLHHSSEHRPPPGPPGGEGEVSPVEGRLAPPPEVAETGGAETFLEVVRQEGVEDRVDGRVCVLEAAGGEDEQQGGVRQTLGRGEKRRRSCRVQWGSQQRM